MKQLSINIDVLNRYFIHLKERSPLIRIEIIYPAFSISGLTYSSIWSGITRIDHRKYSINRVSDSNTRS